MRVLPPAFLAALLASACSSAPPPPPPEPVASSAPLPPSAAPSASAPAPAGPPVAAVKETRDEYFGKEILDPYRWMETDSPEFSAWMKGQSDHTRKVLDAIEVQARLRARVRELDNAGARVANVQRWGGKTFSLEAEPGRDNYKLYVREGLFADKRLLVDPEALSKDGAHVSIDYYSPSYDAKYVAYGLSQGGSEMSSIHVLETTTGKELSDVIDRARYANVSWLDGKSFLYKRGRKLPEGAPATERFTKARVHLHVLGQDPEKDEPLFGSGVSSEIPVPDEAFPLPYAPASSPYAFVSLEHGVQPEVSLYYAPKKSLKGAKTPWKKLVDSKDEITGFEIHGDDLFLVSHHGASRSKVLRTSLKKPDLAKAAEVVPASEAVVSWIGAAKDALYVRKLDGGIGRLFRVPFDKGKPEPVELGGEGSVRGFVTEASIPGALVRLDAWTAAPRMLAFDPAKKSAEVTPIIPPSSVVFKDIVATETKAKSADGTLVPLSIIHAKDLPRDGKNPTYLNGYGSYGSVYEPSFEPMNLAWLERGGIVAVCHVRGGGEYGEDWHRAGKLATKPNTIADFVACAEHLVAEKWTSPAHLAGQGTSAGGIMIGGAIVRRPDLFGAAVIRVGMVNALRFEQIPIGPFNTGEFGTVTTKEGFDMLLAIDAYHAVERGKKYPAVLLTTGITDPRVSPWQMAKMAAKLQAVRGENPILLRVDYGSGHGNGSTKTQREEELADVFSFLTWRIGRK
ncbi:prolyl oligopeptidase family serine peptidase [Polyangium sp. 15x6]|uniref:prolyl oligopeptidase family serine peptidase n=1 Tax=Polyangium sp. 15x6 TaxID=3042687 RepID=UPI00249B18D4|nr:prolyl oligopeptidase family serine peptidase [Polyangium sp. 15x6]MDI3287597.1 prolyl oligopeptidase family serine peptidase [Polyangium sp. 15x6]